MDDVTHRIPSPESVGRGLVPSWFKLLLGIVAVALGLASLIGRIVSPTSQELTRNDFTQDYVSARAWMDGGNPYARTEVLSRQYLGPNATPGIGPTGRYNPHPPISILLAAPLAKMPYRAARAIWLIAMSAAIATAVGLVGRRMGWSRVLSVVFGIGSLAVPITQRHLQLVQSEGLALLLIVIAYIYLERSEVTSGIALGLAAAFRLFPVVLIIPLLRQRKAGAAIAVGAVAIVSTIATSAILGLSNVHRLVTTTSGDNFRLWGPSPQNLSLVGLPFQWLTRSIWHPNQVSLPILAWVLAGLITFAGLWSMIRTPARVSGDPFWGATPILLLVLPLTSEYALILMLPVFLVWIRNRSATHGSVGVPLMIAIAVLLTGIPPGLQFANPQGTSVLASLPYLVPTLALLYMCVVDWRGARTRRNLVARV